MSEESTNAPNWLDRLEKHREKRLQRKLGHEAGAGSPCLKCQDKCSGLDLHFWRKICKVCKCPKDTHDINDEDLDSCRIQFELLGTRPKAQRNFQLPERTMNLDWVPPADDPKIIARYLREMPDDQLPIQGTPASKKRVQNLQLQLPAHDMDASLCDTLTAKEQNSLVEYVSHIKSHCAGQGSIVEMPVHRGSLHTVREANAQFINDMLPPEQQAQSETVAIQLPHLLANKLNKMSIKNNNNIPEKQTSLGKDAELGNRDTESAQIKERHSDIFCHECELPMQDGDLAVNATKRTSALWHAACFKCHMCKQPLADLLYFFHKQTNHVYCLRDYAHVKGIPRCKACDELIFSSEFVMAENHTFHVKHLCCWECDAPLAGNQYVMAGGAQEEQPMCLTCYDTKRAAICRDCGEKIGPNQQGATLQQLHWHVPGCFVCRQCRKNLMKGKVLLHDEQIYCSAPCVAIHSAK